MRIEVGPETAPHGREDYLCLSGTSMATAQGLVSAFFESHIHGPPEAVFWAPNGHLTTADWRIVLRYEPGNDGG